MHAVLCTRLHCGCEFFFFFRSNEVLFSTFLHMGKSRSNFRCLPRLENQDCPQRGDLARGLSAPSPTPHRHSVLCPRTLETGPEAGHRPQQHPQLTGKVLPPRSSQPPPFLPFQVGSQMDHLNPATHGGLGCCSGWGGLSPNRDVCPEDLSPGMSQGNRASLFPAPLFGSPEGTACALLCKTSPGSGTCPRGLASLPAGPTHDHE